MGMNEHSTAATDMHGTMALLGSTSIANAPPLPTPVFFRMTRAQKQAYLDSLSTKRPLLQRLHAVNLLVAENNAPSPYGIATTVAGCMDVMSFERFCTTTVDAPRQIRIELWNPTVWPASFSLPIDSSVATMDRKSNNTALRRLVKSNCEWLTRLLTDRKVLCRRWETAFGKTPPTIQHIQVVVYQPLVVDWKEVETSLWRMFARVNVRTRGCVEWEVQVC